MGSLSFAGVAILFFAHVCTSIAQVVTPSAIPITAPGSAPTNCGGCYVVADVAGIEFGSSTLTQTHTALVSVGANLNSTVVVTSIVGQTEFSFNTAGVLDPVTGTLFNFGGPTVTISGVTLTSPTAYDLFTAYSIISTVFTNGACSTIFDPATTLPTPFRYARSAGQQGVDLAAEEAFIAFLPQLSCSPSVGGVNVSPTSITSVVNSTTTTTTTGTLFKPTLTALPIVTPSSVTPSSTTASSPSSTAIPSSTSSSSTPISTVSSNPLPTIKSSSSFSSISSSTSLSAPLVIPTGGSTTVSILLSTVPSLSTPSSLTSTQATSTVTTSISVVAIIPQNSTTITSTVSVGTIIVAGNTTFIPTGTGGFGPSATIIFSPGQAADWRAGITHSWLFWATGVFSTLLAIYGL